MIQQRVCLRAHNTLRLASTASHYCQVTTTDELHEAATYASQQGLPLVLLGQGSNVVLPRHLNALVVHIALRGVSLVESALGTQVTAAAGESWDSLVQATVSKGLWGLENLSLIPGTVGAAPIQNIGAYGVEVKDHLLQLHALNLENGEVETLSGADCNFGYRDSLFKGAYRGRFAVLDCTFNLSYEAAPMLEYGGLKKILARPEIVSPQCVRDAVCQLRMAKLPDPSTVPNAGSFFKNPIVSEAQASAIEAKFPQLVSFKTDSGRKLAAGWMIDNAGLKGIHRGEVGVYHKQALVLTSSGSADAGQLKKLVEEIQQSVAERFGVLLEVEPQWYNEDGTVQS
ncbi:UDP-N-acetylmuramate dehydrogenase [Aestuariirhabdus sp. LZHN29]|uniref:UDP-N-acetylmuramate dehydrogenase n=1 Tax=Aestuariirhabdus sp. LZHN29 TaxID=3417462 RepID=UPI003CF6CE31